MIPTVSLYIFKSRVNSRGEGKVFIRFTFKRRSTYLNTNIVVPYKYWDPKRQRIKPGYTLAVATNALLDKKLLEIRQQLISNAMTSPVLTSAAAKKTVSREGGFSFFELCDEQLSDLRRAGKVGTADKIQSIYKKFEQFLGGRSATIFDLDQRLLKDYEHYMRNKLGNKQNTIQTNLKAIRRIFSIAVENNWITPSEDPFKLLKLKGEKTVRPFLTKEEMAIIAGLELEEDSHLDRSRDILVWTILSGGMRVSDVLTLKKSHISGRYIEKRIKKTNTPHRIQMPEEAYQILKKYLDRIQGDDGFVFGLIPNSFIAAGTESLDRATTIATVLYNRDLKVLGEMAGIKKQMSSHIARTTFITLAISIGIDMTTVRGIAGHSDLEMTAHYSKYIDNQGDIALSDLAQKIFLKKLK
jgi:integrase/recombinase XerD